MAKKETFTEQLRKAVDASELSRYEICKRIGLDQATMSRFMGGNSGLKMHTLDKLTELLGLELAKRGAKK